VGGLKKKEWNRKIATKTAPKILKEFISFCSPKYL